VVSYLAEGNNRPHSNYPEVLAQVAAGERNIDFVVFGGPRYERWFQNDSVFLGLVDSELYLELIGRADLVITHGGTTLVHALERSVPVLCLPWNSSEAAWAARAEQQGSGMLYPAFWEPLDWRIDPVVHPSIKVAGHWSLRIAAATLRQAIYQLLDDVSYRRAATELSQQLAVARAGTDLVAMVEEAAGSPSDPSEV
jgi:UDP:flavonoid glycosyltransferase YjiC (YdhE family)